MVYKTDGSSHTSGVKNESEICKFLSNRPDDPLKIKECLNCNPGEELQFKHIGGTKDVSDMDILQNGELKSGCSIKNHKKGTFDYINTSRLSDYILDEVVKKIDTNKSQLKDKYYKKPELVDTCRKENNEFTNMILSEFTSDSIKRILSIINERNPDLFIINNSEKKEYLMFTKDKFIELYKYPKQETTYILKKKNNCKTSRCIYRVDESGNEIDTHLRIRLTLNNGVTALLGLSKSNTTASYCIKVQQDDVNSHITNPYSSCKY